MEGGYTYSVTVPATLKGSNGKLVKNPTVSKFQVIHGDMVSATGVSTDKNLSYGEDMFLRYENLTFEGASKASLRLRVTNEGAANALDIYAATYENGEYTVGEKLGTIYVCGIGEYDFDVSEYIGDVENIENVAFCVRTKKEAGQFQTYL